MIASVTSGAKIWPHPQPERPNAKARTRIQGVPGSLYRELWQCTQAGTSGATDWTTALYPVGSTHSSGNTAWLALEILQSPNFPTFQPTTAYTVGTVIMSSNNLPLTTDTQVVSTNPPHTTPTQASRTPAEFAATQARFKAAKSKASLLAAAWAHIKATGAIMDWEGDAPGSLITNTKGKQKTPTAWDMFAYSFYRDPIWLPPDYEPPGVIYPPTSSRTASPDSTPQINTVLPGSIGNAQIYLDPDLSGGPPSFAFLGTALLYLATVTYPDPRTGQRRRPTNNAWNPPWTACRACYVPMPVLPPPNRPCTQTGQFTNPVTISFFNLWAPYACSDITPPLPWSQDPFSEFFPDCPRPRWWLLGLIWLSTFAQLPSAPYTWLQYG